MLKKKKKKKEKEKERKHSAVLIISFKAGVLNSFSPGAMSAFGLPSKGQM